MSTHYNRHPQPPTDVRQERRRAARVLARTIAAVRSPLTCRPRGAHVTLRSKAGNSVVRVPMTTARRLVKAGAWLPTTRAAWKRRHKPEKVAEQRGTLVRIFGSTPYRRRAAA